MPKIFIIGRHTPEDICLAIKQNDPTESIFIFDAAKPESLQELVVCIHALIPFSPINHTITLRPISRTASVDNALLIELAIFLSSCSTTASKLTFTLSADYISKEFFIKVFGFAPKQVNPKPEINACYDYQLHQLKLTDLELLNKILVVYQSELAFVKSKANCRASIVKLNRRYEELMRDNGREMHALEKTSDIERKQLKADIDSFWSDYYSFKSIPKKFDDLRKEADDFLEPLKPKVDNPRPEEVSPAPDGKISTTSNQHQETLAEIHHFIITQFFISYPNEDLKNRRVTTINYDRVLVPTYEAQLLLAEFYKRKYGIEVVILKDWKKDLAHYLKKLLQCEPVKIGLIIWTSNRPDEHVVPLIFDSTAGKGCLIDFDCLGFGKTDPFNTNEKLFNVEKLVSCLAANQLNDNIQVLANGSNTYIGDLEKFTRSVDAHSCFTDALCVLREALIDPNGVKLQLKTTPPSKLSRYPYTFFEFPGAWAITVQNKKYFESNNIDQKTLIRPHLNKITKKTESRSLEDFLNRHRHLVKMSDPAIEAFRDIEANCYLQQKSHKLVNLINSLYQILTDSDLQKIYASRRGGVIEQLESSSTKTNLTSISP